MPYELLLSRIDERLEALGIQSDRKASLRAGLKVDAVRRIRQGHEPKLDTLTRLAKTLQVPPSYFLETIDPGALAVEKLADPEAVTTDDMPAPPGYAYVRKLAIHAGMGGVGTGEEEFDEPELLPLSLIEGELRGAPDDFFIGEVDGQSMEPILMSSDRVVVDRRKRNPSQGGIFWIHDGDGFAAKWVERVHESDPPRLRIFSENQRFKEYTVLAEEAQLIGRVVWFARRI